jgi:phage baseplate assembly protein W|tara:strand:- start:1913 stop:2314 length:402 start_codon:yes stop_codon:yes gene_type:complete
VPLERVSQGFKDLSMSFKKNPLNDDLIGLKNANAIARSIKNIVFTFPGEKPFNESFGSRVSRLLFDNFDDLTASNIKDEIETSIRRFEPRVRLRSVQTTPDFAGNAFDVQIVYDIIGADVPAQQLEFVLQPTR